MSPVTTAVPAARQGGHDGLRRVATDPAVHGNDVTGGGQLRGYRGADAP